MLKTAMLKTVRVREIMAKELVTLEPSLGAGEALRRLRDARISGAPVLEGKKLLGFVSRTDLTAERHDTDGDRMALVAEVMTRVVYAVRPDDPAVFAAKLMAQEGVHRVVVLDQDGHLAGIVAAMDVVRAVAQGNALTVPDPNEPIEFIRVD